MKARAVKGVTSLLGRQVALRVLGFIGMLVLARILTPEMFGVFAIVQFVVLCFEQISSLGLAAALIRKKEPVTELDLRTVFTVQQVAVVCSMVAIVSCAPLVVAHYGLGSDSEWLIRAMALGLLLASLKTVPTILLERQLRHDLVAVSDVGEYLAYQIAAIALAFMGFGIWALAIAVLVRGFVGTLILCSVSWWRPRLGIERQALRSILRFGLPIQMASLVSLANNAVVPTIVGTVLGVSAVGYVNFARNLLDAAIFQPLILMGRVQLRIFARAQDQPGQLRRAVERSSFGGAAFVGLLAALLVSQAEPLIEYWATSKWQPVLPLLYVLGPVYLLHTALQPLTQMLKAMGDATTPLQIALVVLVVQAATFVLLGKSFGLMGYAVSLALGIVSATVYACLRARRRIPLRPLIHVLGPIAAAIVAGIAAALVNRRLHAPVGVVLSIATAIAVYALGLVLLSGERLRREVKDVMSAIGAEAWIARLLNGSANASSVRK